MLIVSRKKSQKVVIADDIEITILDLGRNRVRFGINAPKHVTVQTRAKNCSPLESKVDSSEDLAPVVAYSRVS